MSEIIKVKELYKSFSEGGLKVDVLKGINLTMNSGESLAIIGRSGSGKSTLLQILAGLDVFDAGDVLVLNENVSQMSIKRQSDFRNKNMGFVYQFHHLLPDFTALENVAMPLIIGGVSEKVANEKAQFFLEKVGLKHRLRHRPSQLSGGEKQRVSIARSVVSSPKCIFADEPTGNLDKETADMVLELFLSLSRDIGSSIIIVTHDKELANKCNRVVTMNKGVLTEGLAI